MTRLTPAQRRTLDSTLERTREPLGFTRPSHAASTMPDPNNPDRDEADINAMLDLLDKGEVSVLALCDCTKRSLQSLADLLESDLARDAFANFERIYQARQRLLELRKKFIADAALVRIASAAPISHREAESVRKSANKIFEEHRRKTENGTPRAASAPKAQPPRDITEEIASISATIPVIEAIADPTPRPPISLPVLDLPTFPPANKQGRCPRTGPASAASMLLNHTGSVSPLPRGADFQSAIPSHAAPIPAATAAAADTSHAGSAASPKGGDQRTRTKQLASSP